MESGEHVVVGVNRFESTEPSPLQAEGAAAVELLDPAIEAGAVEAIRAWRAGRDAAAVRARAAASCGTRPRPTRT